MPAQLNLKPNKGNKQFHLRWHQRWGYIKRIWGDKMATVGRFWRRQSQFGSLLSNRNVCGSRHTGCQDELLKNKVQNYNHIFHSCLLNINRNTNFISQLTCMQVQRQVSPRPCWWRRSSPGATWPKLNRAKATLNTCFPATFTLQRLLPSPCTAATIQLTRESGRETASWEGGKEGGRGGGKEGRRESCLHAGLKYLLSKSWNKPQPNK